MRLTLVRHATLLVELGGRRLLVDPMLDEEGARPPIGNTPNAVPNPTVALPFPPDDVVRDLDGIVVTHLHADHLDETAIRLLPRGVPVLCQPPDVERLEGHGLGPLVPIDDAGVFVGLPVARTGGQHGTGEIARMLAPVSGFVLTADGRSLYLAGDTIWVPEVAAALERRRPDVIVVNAGGARFLEGDPITMTPDDVIAVARAAPAARLVAVHMESINHCLVTRDELEAAVVEAGVDVLIPDDGETLEL
jgi:L-ascorbate metabolism protein UlaG (beta-lactamase superfamily)